MKDRKLKDSEIKNKREIKELLFKSITVSVHDMDKFEQKETKKKRHIKNTWYDRLINDIPEPIRKFAGRLKQTYLKIMVKNRISERKETK